MRRGTLVFPKLEGARCIALVKGQVTRREEAIPCRVHSEPSEVASDGKFMFLSLFLFFSGRTVQEKDGHWRTKSLCKVSKCMCFFKAWIGAMCRLGRWTGMCVGPTTASWNHGRSWAVWARMNWRRLAHPIRSLFCHLDPHPCWTGLLAKRACPF